MSQSRFLTTQELEQYIEDELARNLTTWTTLDAVIPILQEHRGEHYSSKFRTKIKHGIKKLLELTPQFKPEFSHFVMSGYVGVFYQRPSGGVEYIPEIELAEDLAHKSWVDPNALTVIKNTRRHREAVHLARHKVGKYEWLLNQEKKYLDMLRRWNGAHSQIRRVQDDAAEWGLEGLFK